ncbi:MAG: quinone oxidoreductase [Alphaproteobacteria bacterium]|nr:quinone oxidoreductase [Alphaproteobacteria bacterium]
MKAKAIRIEKNGGPEVMRMVEVEVPDPGAGEIHVRNTAIGFNFIDTYHRLGRYPVQLPSGLGTEGAGVVEAVGRGVRDLKVGQHVVYLSRPSSYAELVAIPADSASVVPAGVSDRIAAASYLKGMTAEFLLRRTHRLKKGDTVLLYAAAGGVGLIFLQWARSIGATVIGVVSTDAKARVARANGAAHTIVTSKQNVVKRVRQLTGGKGVDVVYDPVGKDAWNQSLQCLRMFGLMVSFGSASGLIEPVDINGLANLNSPFITRASLNQYGGTKELRRASSRALYGLVRKGAIKVQVGKTYPFTEAGVRQLHTEAEARILTGSALLIP